MNDKAFRTIKEFEGSVYWLHDITKRLEEGWHYIGHRIKRDVQQDGSFEEEFIHLMGHESDNP